MCFSASASFTAAAVLLLCGIAALIKAKKNQQYFAAIPLLFAVQQFIEGTIWQSITAGTSAQLATYAYLTFVYVVWPNWVPFSINAMSSTASEKRALFLPMIAGIAISILAISYLVVTTPVAAATCNNITYVADVPKWLWLPGSALYLFATIAPFFICKIKHLWLMGVGLAISYAATAIFYHAAILSVWCFFAAVLSVFVFIILR
jgi:hypothetical protein